MLMGSKDQWWEQVAEEKNVYVKLGKLEDDG
jgi:hypothetical protein